MQLRVAAILHFKPQESNVPTVDTRVPQDSDKPLLDVDVPLRSAQQLEDIRRIYRNFFDDPRDHIQSSCLACPHCPPPETTVAPHVHLQVRMGSFATQYPHSLAAPSLQYTADHLHRPLSFSLETLSLHGYLDGTNQIRSLSSESQSQSKFRVPGPGVNATWSDCRPHNCYTKR
ncbi:hypothetical protein M405DRAFT_79830 [Rhizopogon salebrosus TDB-379]|nr:hypothetical protein M405DRAFT_79830 [Rhizopogon salebrosus TDB-379]